MEKWLSVVVIGRNEAKNLNNLFTSLVTLSNLLQEIIYVDSASSDGSAEIAQSYGAKVLQLKASPYLSASAGRFVGTRLAEGDWILYLDGDMELENEFIDFLNKFPHNRIEKNLGGFIGKYKYIDTANNKVIDNAQSLKEGYVEFFGGAVLLNRNIVIQAGNWSPEVFSNEEIELYSRIQKVGYKVYGMEIPMIRHYTEFTSSLYKIYELFLPFKGNKKFFGAGQAVVSSIKSQSFQAYFKAWPFPNIFLLADLLIILTLSLFRDYRFLLFFLIIQFTLFLAVKYPRRFILFHALAIRIPFGSINNLISYKDLKLFRKYLENIKG